MKIHGATHSNLEGKLFKRSCHTQTNNIPAEGLTFKEKGNKIVLKMGIKFQCSND
jgi:hypothetical protein